MQPLKERAAFNFSINNSFSFQLPLPNEAILYRELEVVDASIAGIHKLILFKIVHEGRTAPEHSTLVHIHNSYATWRNRQNMEGNYLLR